MDASFTPTQAFEQLNFITDHNLFSERTFDLMLTNEHEFFTLFDSTWVEIVFISVEIIMCQ